MDGRPDPITGREVTTMVCTVLAYLFEPLP
jgi:hypothetical protein